MPLPWMHFSPASMTDHFELSIMTGTLAMAGSAETRLRKRVIASSPSIRSASMFTSMTLAPFSTCSRATTKAASKLPSLIRRAKRLEPVIFVRSPIIRKFVSGRTTSGSMPL